MTAKPIVLYVDDAWISPWVFAVFVALREKALPFEMREVALEKGEQLRPEYGALSVTARVPALDHGGLVISESSAIVEYLEEEFAPPEFASIFPEDRRERAHARQLMSWLRSDDTLPLRASRPTTTMFQSKATTPLDPNAARAVAKLVAVSERLLPVGALQLFSTWSLADAELAFTLHRLILSDDALPPNLKAYAEAQWARPSVRAFIDRKR
jgi:glutathione S-transferase